MNRRDLVKAAIAHKPAPRVPYFIDLCPEAWEVMKKSTVAQTPEEFLDNDVQDIAVPWWAWHNLGADWIGPDVPTSPATTIGLGNYTNLAEDIKRLRQKSDKYFLVRIYGSHFEKAYFARGIENLLADMAGEPEFCRDLCRRIIEKNLVMLENFLAIAEIDGVLLGSDWGSQRGLLMSPDCWREMIRPGEQKEYDLIHAYGKDVWVHSCGNIVSIIPDLVEMGLDVLNPIQPEAMDIRQLKEKFGHKLAYWGGISTQQTLPYGTPEEVKTEARKVRQLLSAGGGYIFAPAQGIQGDVPAANIMALLEVANDNSEKN